MIINPSPVTANPISIEKKKADTQTEMNPTLKTIKLFNIPFVLYKFINCGAS